MNFKSVLMVGVLAVTTFTACNPDPEFVEPRVTFKFRFGTDAEIAACDPTQGGTKEACLQVPLEAMFGVAYAHGIGRRGEAGAFDADCVVAKVGEYDIGKGPTPSYAMYVQGQFLLKAQYGRFDRAENDSRNQQGIALKLQELIQTGQCRF